MKEALSFAWGSSLETADSYLCFWLALLHSFTSLCQSPSLTLCTVFDSILSNIDEVFSITPSANVFVFENFNVHHNDWLTHSGGTDRPGELCYSFSISNDLTHIVNSPTWIHDCDSHSPALLDLFLSSHASICSTMAFPPLENSDQVVVSVSIDVPISSKQDVLFHCVAILFLIGMVFVIIWKMFRGRISLNSVPLLLLVNFVSDFRLKLMFVSMMFIWFSAACSAAIVHRKYFFVCTNRINFLNLR